MHSTHLENFLMIIECGSINKAAQKLFMSQSNLSQQLKLLEDEVGTNLFERAGRKLTLTPAGRVLAEYAEKQVNCLKKTLDKITFMKYGASETINIGIAQTSLIPAIGKWIGRMNKEYPSLSYNFINFNFPKCLELMEKEEIDIVLTRQIVASADFLANYEVKEIAQHKVVAVVPPSIDFGDVEEISLKDIDGLNVIIRGKHDKRFLEKCAKYDSTPIVKCRCRNNILKFELIKNDVGIGFFMDSVLGTDILKNTGLKHYKVKEIAMLNKTYLVYPKDKANSSSINYLQSCILALKNMF